jgi:hypothetical protein
MSQPQQGLTEFDLRGQRDYVGSPGVGGGDGAESRMMGFVLFAGTVMILVGAFEVILGLTALFSSGYYDTAQDPLVTSDFDAWGWMHTVLGAVAILAGLGLYRGKLWARILGILFALTCAVVNLGFLSVAPFLSATVIVLCIVCVFAITVHGAELEDW